MNAPAGAAPPAVDVRGAAAVPAPRTTMRASAVFVALLRRDMRVARRQLPFFLVRTILQPLMLLIVFGYLLPKMGFVQGGYTTALVPGILAISLTLSAIQSVALPLVEDFGWTKEIEDRLLAPVPTRVVAAEKIVAGVVQGVIAALFVFPISWVIVGPVAHLTPASAAAALLVTILGATAFSALGLLLGTAISPQQIGLMFSVIIGPMLFFGCAYYPWRGLDRVPAIKYLVLVNPLVYVAEGLRGTLTPGVPHMPLPVVALALVLIAGVFWTLGVRSFMRRAVG